MTIPYRVHDSDLDPVIFLISKTFKLFWLPNRLTVSVPDQGYSRNASYTLNYLCSFL
jgi:hypothetical protein